MAAPVATRAPLNSRINAGVIDFAISCALFVLIAVTGHRWLESGTTRIILIELVIGYWFVLSSWWSTPGGWLNGLRLVDEQGCPPSLTQIIARSLMPGSMWVAVFIILGYQQDLPLDEQGPLLRPLIAYLVLSPIIWFVTAKLGDDGWSTYSDRFSGTRVMQYRKHLWILPWLDWCVRASSRWVEAEVNSSFDALREKVTYGFAWFIETITPLGPDVRRGIAKLVDLALLLVIYLLLRGRQGPFAQNDSWYFLVIAAAVFLFVVLPAHGWSPGKRILGLRIVDHDGNAPGYRSALVRTLLPGTIWVVLLVMAPQWDLIPAAEGLQGVFYLALIASAFLAVSDVVSYLGNPVFSSMHDQAAGTFVLPNRKATLIESKRTMEDAGVRRTGRWPRFIGLLVDLTLIVLCIGLNEALFPGSLHVDERYVGMTVIFIGYFVGFVALGTTPGSWIAGTRIVARADGARPGVRRAAIRILPYAPGLVFMGFQTSPLAFHFEANERVKAVADLVLLALLLAMAVDLLAFLRGREPMHDQLAGTTVTGCAASSRRGRLRIWVRDRWRWLTGAEPELSPNA